MDDLPPEDWPKFDNLWATPMIPVTTLTEAAKRAGRTHLRVSEPAASPSWPVPLACAGGLPVGSFEVARTDRSRSVSVAFVIKTGSAHNYICQSALRQLGLDPTHLVTLSLLCHHEPCVFRKMDSPEGSVSLLGMDYILRHSLTLNYGKDRPIVGHLSNG